MLVLPSTMTAECSMHRKTTLLTVLTVRTYYRILYFQMQCLPLFSILKALGNPKIDYLSLDVEGAEEGVLETLPWDKVDISVIGLEVILEKHDEKASGEHINSFPATRELLVSKGYDLVRTDWHTDEKKSIEAYFVQKDLAKEIDKKYFKSAL